MNFLQIAQRAARESKIPNWTQLLTTKYQGGLFREIVDAVQEAWRDLQTKHDDWDWMRQTASFTTVAGQDEYPLGTGAGTVGVLAADFGSWQRDTFRNYVTATGTNSEIPMDWMEFDHWRDTYRFGAMRNTRTRPVTIAVTPDKGIALGPNVADGYTITGYYYRSPTSFAADADEPNIPARYHMLLAWMAAELFCSAQEEPKYGPLSTRASLEADRLMRQLSANRRPQLVFAGPIA